MGDDFNVPLWNCRRKTYLLSQHKTPLCDLVSNIDSLYIAIIQDTSSIILSESYFKKGGFNILFSLTKFFRKYDRVLQVMNF